MAKSLALPLFFFSPLFLWALSQNGSKATWQDNKDSNVFPSAQSWKTIWILRHCSSQRLFFLRVMLPYHKRFIFILFVRNMFWSALLGGRTTLQTKIKRVGPDLMSPTPLLILYQFKICDRGFASLLDTYITVNRSHVKCASRFPSAWINNEGSGILAFAK